MADARAFRNLRETGKIVHAKAAAEMGMKEDLLESFSLGENSAPVWAAAATGGDPMTSANMRNRMECVRSRKTLNAGIDAGYSHSVALCMNVAAIQTEKVTFDDKTEQVMAGGKRYAG